MPRIKDIVGKEEEYIDVLKKRYLHQLIPVFEEGLRLYEVWKKYKKYSENLRAERNRLTEEFAKRRDENIRRRAEEIKREIERIEAGLKEIERRLRDIELRLPNWLDEKVPLGPDERFEKPVKYFGKPKVYREFEEEFKKENPNAEYELIDWKPMHHYDIVREFGLADTDIAAEITGSRFYIEKNELPFLDLALSLYAMEFFYKKGFNEVLIPPYMLRRGIEERITYFEAFEEAIFTVREEDYILITTSEHPICAIYKDNTFEEKELPKRILAWSPAFRREAGAHGKDTKGIFRTKQFHKVELHTISTLDDQYEELEYLINVVDEFMKTLEIPYRIVIVPSGDMDKRALIQYDVQAWFPGQGRYRETHSIATMGSWVSEKMNIKVNRKGKREFVANLYATGVAVQRTLLAIFENHYDPEEGIIRLPRIFKKYLPWIEELRKK